MYIYIYIILIHFKTDCMCNAHWPGCSPKKEACGRHEKWVDARCLQGHIYMLKKCNNWIISSKEVCGRRPSPSTPDYTPGVTGHNIPPAGVYPDILWPRLIYTRGYIIA